MMKIHNAFGLIGLAAIIITTGCGKPQEPEADPVRPVKILKLEAAARGGVIEFPAMIRARNTVEMSFNVPGTVAELPVLEGSPVQAGVLLASLDNSEFKSRYEAAKAAFTLAQNEFNRFEELQRSGSVAVAELDRKRSELQAANTNMELAAKSLSDTELHAPYDGLVARRIVNRFANIQPKQPVLIFQAIRPLDVVIDVPESIILQSANRNDRNPTASIRFDFLPNIQLPVTLHEISTEVDPQTRTYRVVFSLDNTGGLTVLPGMSATLGAELGDHETDHAVDRFLIPPLAVVNDASGKTSVWVRDPATGTVSKREITVGRLSSEGIEVLGGLQSGDEVVIAGISKMQTGMQVRPLQP